MKNTTGREVHLLRQRELYLTQRSKRRLYVKPDDVFVFVFVLWVLLPLKGLAHTKEEGEEKEIPPRWEEKDKHLKDSDLER